MLDQLLHIFRLIHIPFGLLGLAVFWLPLVLRKGSRWHRRIGWIFVVCMAVASVTAAVLALLRMLLAAQAKGGLATLSPHDYVGPVFLTNVALLTFISVHHGIAVLRQKKQLTPSGPSLPVLLPAVLVLVSLGSIGLGIATGSVLMFTLPIVGLVVGSLYFFALVRRHRDPMFWWFQHMAGMLGGCIAAITAATITNARHIRPFIPAPDWAFWIAPAAIGLPLLLIWQASYRRKFAKQRSGPAASSPAPRTETAA